MNKYSNRDLIHESKTKFKGKSKGMLRKQKGKILKNHYVMHPKQV